MRVAALYSGGKDSTLAVQCAMERGWEVTHLITLHPKRADSFLFHHPNTHLTRLQADAMGIPLVEEESSGEEGREYEDLRRAVARVAGAVDGIVSGAVASEYQRVRIERACAELGLKAFAPLWHKPPEVLLRRLLELHYEIAFSSVSAEGLDASWLGRPLDEAAVADLLRLHGEKGVHPTGEGGEYETLTLWAPFFRQRIVVEEARKEWRRDHGAWVVAKARLNGPGLGLPPPRPSRPPR